MVDLGEREKTGNCSYFLHSDNNVSLDADGDGLVPE